MSLHETVSLDTERAAAWKYVGYPKLSTLMASSNDCFAMRKFGALNIRVLLKLQNDIVTKERTLLEMDQASRKGHGCHSLQLDENTPRERLLDQIAALTKDYSKPAFGF